MFMHPFPWITIPYEPIPLLEEERAVGHGHRRWREEEESSDDEDDGDEDGSGGPGPNVGEMRVPHKRKHVDIPTLAVVANIDCCIIGTGSDTVGST